MNAIPTDFPGRRANWPDALVPANANDAPFAPGAAAGEDSAVVTQWAALREAAWAIALLAGPEAEAEAADVIAFPAHLHTLTGMRQRIAQEAISDLVAVMEVGLTAILSAHENGGRPAAAARALWTEFTHARQGLEALAPIAQD